MSTILNLACGTKISADPRVINLDWSPYIILTSRPLLRRIVAPFLDSERRQRLESLDARVAACDLRKGIPFPDKSVDAVYHSHFLEHLDRDAVPGLFQEIRRVLKPGGVHRVVVPDLEALCKDYLADCELCVGGSGKRDQHEERIAAMFEQCVRREAYGTSTKRSPRRQMENLLLGDARRRGETHQWMYDRVSLISLLESSGFRSAARQSHVSSAIERWEETRLDADERGNEYKPGSLYVEAIV